MAYVDQIEVDGVVNELQDSTARQQIEELSEVAHSGDYNDLLNKPDLSGFITRSVNDLVNYYTKTETYTKTVIDGIVATLNTGISYDVSALHPTSGVNGGSTYASLSAALAVIPQDKRKGGMTIKYVHSSDNNSAQYVQYRYMMEDADTVATFTNTDNWSFCGDDVIMPSAEYIRVITDDENKILFGIKGDGSVEWFKGIPTAVKNYVDAKIAEIRDGNEGTGLDGLDKIITFLNDFSTSDTLKNLLNTKVDAEEGKSLIDSQYAQTIISNEYVQVIADSEDKILEGIDKDGKHIFNSGVGISDCSEQTPMPNNDWLSVVTDNEYKVIEGIKPDGSKHISKFDDDTQQVIKDISNGNGVFEIPVMDANFSTPLHYKVFNGDIEDNTVKGTEDAKYVFDLPLSNESWIVRFKFRITENILNEYDENDESTQKKVIANIGDSEVYAKVIPLTQRYETGEYNGDDYSDAWPTTDGGIAYNKDSIDNAVFPRNIGMQAFSAKYVGNGDSATLENDGTKIILRVDNEEPIEYAFDSPEINNSMEALFKAMAPYSVVKTTGLTDPPVGATLIPNTTAVKIASNIYSADQIPGLTLPSAVGNSLTYYQEVNDGGNTSYTSFVITKTNSELELQYIALDQRKCDELAIFEPISLKGIIHTGMVGFTVKYVGNGASATIGNNGSRITLVVDNQSTYYDFSTYGNDLSALVAALETNTDLQISYDTRVTECSMLDTFGSQNIKDEEYSALCSAVIPHVDAAPFYMYYAVSNKWHQVEIFKKGDSIYSVCDGVYKIVANTENSNILTLGGDCGILFKDFQVCTNGTLDTEYINGYVLSSASPYILIFEGHGMVDCLADDVTPEISSGGMSSLNPESLEYFMSVLDDRGYIPVDMNDISQYFVAGTPLPKRCYTFSFDDYQWELCMNNTFRRVFNRHGAKPNFEIITGNTTPIYHNGRVITKQQAATICKDAGFTLATHTKSHRQANISPSDYVKFLTQDIYDADIVGINTAVFGHTNGDLYKVYLHDVLEFVGYKIGIEAYRYNNTTNISHKPYILSRVNIGRIIYNDGRKYDYSFYTNKFV